MAGKLCAGQDPADKSPSTKDSKAYCEGRRAAKDGILVGANPHEAGSDAANAWDAGHASWSADPAAGPGQDCCATAYGGGYVAPP